MTFLLNRNFNWAAYTEYTILNIDAPYWNTQTAIGPMRFYLVNTMCELLMFEHVLFYTKSKKKFSIFLVNFIVCGVKFKTGRWFWKFEMSWIFWFGIILDLMWGKEIISRPMWQDSVGLIRTHHKFLSFQCVLHFKTYSKCKNIFIFNYCILF